MKKLLLLMLALACTVSLSGCAKKTALSPDAPVTLTMWHVYGEQADSPMNRLVDQFNETVGKENGIIIDVTVVTNSVNLGPQLLDAHAAKPGAPAMPDLFSCFPGIAEKMGVENLLDWRDCFTEEELSHFVKEFVQEGMVEERLAVFPVSKSSYALFVNGSQFERFSADTGVTYSDLADWTGFFDSAAKYYEWSKGKSFCAIDYLLQTMELDALARGADLYNGNGWYDCENPTLRDSWMKFARALAQGHITLSDPYASTQLTTGEALAGIGSTAGILYFNDVVTYPDNTSEPTNLRVLPLPKTEAVNNGAFDAIDDYSFPNASYAELYEAINTMRETYEPFVQTADNDFYVRANAFYEDLRQIQPSWNKRALQGEAIDILAEESWDLFCTVS